MAGSIEVLIGSGETEESLGGPVKAATVAEVPIVVKVNHGITGLAPVENPEPRGSKTPVAAWTATTDDGRPVAVRLWEDLPFDQPTAPVDDPPA